MGLRVTLSALAVPIAAGLGFLIYADRSTTLKIGLVVMLCSIPFAVSSEVSGAYFSSKLRNTVLAVIAVVQQVTFVGLVILAVSLHKSVVFCLGAALVGMIVASILTNALARREVPFAPSYDRGVWWSMLRTSSPIGLAYVVGLLYFKADTLILSFLSTSKQIGYYGAAYSIVSVFLVLPTVLTRTFLPSMVRASKETIEGSIRSTLIYFSIGGTFSATAIMVCGPTVIRVVAGSRFGASNAPLRILGAGLVFIFIATALSSVCIARGSGNKIFVMSVVSLVLNVALNIVAIPTFGIKGAAVATLICEVISLALFIRLVRSEVGVHVRVIQSLARPFVAGLITCVVLAPIYLRSNLSISYGLALIPSTCVLYLASLALLKGLPRELVTSIRSWVVALRAGARKTRED
jgi:O-antigen/teichoic acid export membrane protein